MSTTVKNTKMARRYEEEFKRQAVELLLHSGKTQRQVARELDVSDYSLTLWKKAYLGQQKPAGIEGQMKSPEESGDCWAGSVSGSLAPRLKILTLAAAGNVSSFQNLFFVSVHARLR
jgi:transposase-like protein